MKNYTLTTVFLFLVIASAYTQENSHTRSPSSFGRKYTNPRTNTYNEKHLHTGSCFNADLETGTVDGYQTYTGSIDNDGQVVIDIPETDENRHKIMHISDGFDPIALRHCTVFKELSVVPSNRGRYAMRLGNSDTGAQAERVVLTFTVTPELSFFQLSYAVVLNDPGHADFEQPRFEMRILDENGAQLDCGEYQVRAAENIPGFETCSSGWRVRPWTTVGFELQSYLGQTIQIEILTTDCSQGGHAGYAYLDATCRPLELKLEGYCPGNTAAQMSVTEGFTKYEWSTGDSTNVIDIQNPTEGTPYAVTVTSATGCTLVLRDTIPEIGELPAPIFDEPEDVYICPGERVWIRPTGRNLLDVFSENYNYYADSILVNPESTESFTFTASDRYGCQFDAVTYTVKVQPQINATARTASCADGSDGRITLNPEGNFEPFEFAWSDGSTDQNRNNLSAGTYTVTVTDARGCSNTTSIAVESPPELSIDFNVTNISCFGATDGEIIANPTGGAGGYTLNWQGLESSSNTLTDLSAGIYTLQIIDSSGCIYTKEAIVNEPEELSLSATLDSVSCHGGKDGAVYPEFNGGTPRYTLQIFDENRQTVPAANNLSVGTYALIVTDASGCKDSLSVNVKEPLPVRFDLTTTDATCFGKADGLAIYSTDGGTAPYRYSWNQSNNATAQANDLLAGDYQVTITDLNNCTVESSFTIAQPDSVQAQLQVQHPFCEGGQNGSIGWRLQGGTAPYQWKDTIFNRAISASDLTEGTYLFNITDANGCVAVLDTVQLEDIISTFQTAKVDVLCFGEATGEASVIPTDGYAPYLYRWSNNTSGSVANQLVAGSYQVTVTDANACQYEFATTITEPPLLTVQLTPDSVRCFSELNGAVESIANGGTAPYSFLWSNGDTTINLRNLPSGNYQLTITDANQCETIANTEVYEPLELVITSVAKDVTCFGGQDGYIRTRTRGGILPYRYSWSNGTTNFRADELAAGQYELTVTDGNGCQTIDSSFLSQPDSMMLMTDIQEPTCFGFQDAALLLDVLNYGSVLYSLDGRNYDATPSFDQLSAGDYTLFVQDQKQCTYSFSIPISDPEPLVIDLPAQYEILLGESILLSPTINLPDEAFYFWQEHNSLNCMDCRTPTANPKNTIHYFLTVETEKGCIAEAITRVQVIKDWDKLIYAPTAFSPNGDGQNEYFMIFPKTDAVKQISDFQIFDRWGGNVIYEEKEIIPPVEMMGWDGTLRGRHLNPGTFVWTARINFIDGREEVVTSDFILVR